MHEEFYTLQHNGTWTLVPTTDWMNIIGNKWIFKLKPNPNGSTSRYKAHLVAKGFHQTPEIDFKETFS